MRYAREITKFAVLVFLVIGATAIFNPACSQNKKKVTMNRFETTNLTPRQSNLIKKTMEKQLTYYEKRNNKIKTKKKVSSLVSRMDDLYVVTVKVENGKGRKKRVTKSHQGTFDTFRNKTVTKAVNEALK